MKFWELTKIFGNVCFGALVGAAFGTAMYFDVPVFEGIDKIFIDGVTEIIGPAGIGTIIGMCIKGTIRNNKIRDYERQYYSQDFR